MRKQHLQIFHAPDYVLPFVLPDPGKNTRWLMCCPDGGTVDAEDLKSFDRKIVRVRIPLRAPDVVNLYDMKYFKCLCFAGRVGSVS